MKTNFRRALVLGGGPEFPPQPPVGAADSLVICADGGAELAGIWRLEPACIIGDLDSLTPAQQRQWDDGRTKIIRYPREKDATDLELAVAYALDRQVDEIWLAGVWGGRADHSMGNMELLYGLAQQKKANRLFFAQGWAAAVAGLWRQRLSPKTIVSLLPMTADVSGVTTRGLRYQLNNAVLSRGRTLSISNYATGPEVEVTVKEGILLVMVMPPESS